MERGLRAFFYDYHYYLFPDGMTLGELKAAGKVRVRHLKEERCMAPDFVYESVVEEELTIEAPERIFEVAVNLYTGAEYDAILKQHVERVCPGCERYEDDGTDSLNGHHSEMSLDGVCYLRSCEEEQWSFSDSVDYFWYRISCKLNDLAACVDENDQEKLTALINEELEHIYVPLNFFGTVCDGAYCLYLRGDWRNSPSAFAVERYLAECAMTEHSPIREAGWKVSYLLPAGTVHYSCKYDEKRMGRIEENGNGTVTVYLFVPEGENDVEARIDDFFACMAEDIGEYAALCAIGGLQPTSDARGLLSRRKLAKALEKASDAFLAMFEGAESGTISPYAMIYGYSGGADEQQLPFREKLSEGFTQYPDLSLLERSSIVIKDGKADEPWWLRLFTFAYLYVPDLESGSAEYETLFWYITNVEQAPLYEKTERGFTAVNIGFGYGQDRGIFFDQIVADEKRYFRILRMLAPVLRAYRAKAVTVNEGGVMAYGCDYDFAPIDADQ